MENNPARESTHTFPDIPLESIFRNVFLVLDEIQQSAKQIQAVPASVEKCARDIESLKRARDAQIRHLGHLPSADPYGIREALDNFTKSCNAFTYACFTNDELDDALTSGGCLFPSSRVITAKKKQLRTYDVDFAEHERKLALLLSNSV
jgi:hypothetical protein